MARKTSDMERKMAIMPVTTYVSRHVTSVMLPMTTKLARQMSPQHGLTAYLDCQAY